MTYRNLSQHIAKVSTILQSWKFDWKKFLESLLELSDCPLNREWGAQHISASNVFEDITVNSDLIVIG